MLEEWRATRDPVLEPLIARVGRRIARRQAALAGPKAVIEIAWHALARDAPPTDIERLLDAPWPANWRPALARVEALSKLPPDPRTALAVARVAGGFASRNSVPLHRVAAQLLVASACEALRPELGVLAGLHPMLARLYRPVTIAIDQLPPRKANPGLVARARDAVAGEVQVADLFAQVWREPGNLALRTVLGDALQETGDPRGEFIALQLQGGTQHRIAALLDRYGDRWTGPLPGVTSRVFENGFVSRLAIEAPGHVLAPAIERPEWATVESLQLVAPDFDPAPLVRRMPVLRDLMLRDDDLLARLEQGGPFPSLRRLGVADSWLPAHGNAFPDLQVFVTACSRRVAWDAPQYQKLLGAVGARGIPALALYDVGWQTLDDALAALHVGPPVIYLAFAWTFGFDPPGWRLRIARDPLHADLAFHGTAGWTDSSGLRTIVAALTTAGIEQLTVHTPLTKALREIISGVSVRWVDEPLPIE